MGVVYEFHELAKQWELLPSDELAEMASNMKLLGYDDQYPILLFEGKILDGRNRYLAAQKAGVVCATLQFDGTYKQAEAYVHQLNELRRHSPEELRQRYRLERIERIAARRKAGQSLPSIAEAEEVSLGQVQLDLKKASTLYPPYKVEPEDGKVKGKDGKTRTATRKKPKPKPPEPIEVEEDKPEAELTKPVKPPKPGSVKLTLDPFEKHLAEAQKFLDGMARGMNLVSEKGTLKAGGDYGRISDHLNNACTAARAWFARVTNVRNN